jgi:hypothetical protein
MQRNLLGLDLQELTAIAGQAGQPPYRGRQLFQAMYTNRLNLIDEISTLPKDFRSWIQAQNFALQLPEIEKKRLGGWTARYPRMSTATPLKPCGCRRVTMEKPAMEAKRENLSLATGGGQLFAFQARLAVL